jgi:preprotein translocase subunit SecY
MLLVTIILIVVYRLGILVPIPFLNVEGIKDQLNTSTLHNPADEQFSIFMLGIMPYVSAYILVEIFSLFIPFLKKLRSGDYQGRLKLKSIALVLSMGLAIFHATSLIKGLKSWSLSDAQTVLTISNRFEYVVLVAVLVGCFFLLVAICELITRFGIGHGISIILLSGICGDFIGGIPILFKRLEYYVFSSYLIALIAFCALIFVTLILLKTKISIPCYHEKDNTTVYYFQLNLSPSSMAALSYATSIIMLPVTLSHFFGTESSMADSFRPGSFGYNMISCIFVFAFSFLFGWAFLHPKRRVSKMRARGWHIANIGTTAEKFILKRQFIYNLPWTIFLCVMVVAPNILISGANVPFYLGGSSIPVIVAIVLDLTFGFKFYQNNLRQPIKIAELHDIYDANMIKNHFNAVGINSYLCGYHHRLLRYFFAPHLEMSLIVDAQDQLNAQLLIQKYYNGLGLCRTNSST